MEQHITLRCNAFVNMGVEEGESFKQGNLEIYDHDKAVGARERCILIEIFLDFVII